MVYTVKGNVEGFTKLQVADYHSVTSCAWYVEIWLKITQSLLPTSAMLTKKLALTLALSAEKHFGAHLIP